MPKIYAVDLGLELHYWEDRSAHEAAAILGTPTGTAKTRLRRARQLLAELLAAPDLAAA